MKFKLLIVALAASLLSTGCSAVRTYHGYIPERGESPDAAEVGVDTKASILQQFGEPSTFGTFDPNMWYYISERSKRHSFFKERTHWRKVVALTFSEDSTLAEIEVLDIGDGDELALIDRITPTRGKELSFFEQLFGNIGRLPTGPQGGGGPGR